MLTTQLGASLTIAPKVSAQEPPPVAHLTEEVKSASGKPETSANKPGRPASTPVTLKTDTVTLSDEGKAAQASAAEKEQAKNNEELDNEALHKLSSGEAHNKEVSEQDEVDTSVIDALIAKLEERILEVEQQIKELTGRDDEASVEQLKTLSEQLVMLNGQLLALYKEKEEMIKGGANT
ncbi:hypothetical protein [Thalassomonas sp. RHCl1]|uniref:hypothetical protein n=1 Tax=Thalassomonas sp. RHCl1 TaxID=2995320 RepID=UPI00248AEC97|nr:hypothetical protein [Thalassomonas sp. RHCl1]